MFLVEKNESVEKNEETTETVITTTKEAQKLEGNETPNPNATDDAKDTAKDDAKEEPRVDVEEVETTTVIESSTKPTARTRGRGRGRRPSR